MGHRALPGVLHEQDAFSRLRGLRGRAAGGAGEAGRRGRDVRFRFALEKGTLYAFWVSRRANGASNGYLAGGGPDYDGLVDR